MKPLERLTILEGYSLVGGGYASVLADTESDAVKEYELYDLVPTELRDLDIAPRGTWEITVKFTPAKEGR